jgi:hypothetical protein
MDSKEKVGRKLEEALRRLLLKRGYDPAVVEAMLRGKLEEV